MAALTFDDAQDLVRYIVLHPELQAQLRPVILSAELLDLPAQTQRNAEAIERLSEETRAQGQLIDQLARKVDRLADALEAGFARTDNAIGELRGMNLESWYERRLQSLLGTYMSRPRFSGVDRMDPVLDARESGVISGLDWDNLARAYLLITGNAPLGGGPMAVAVEVSWTIDRHDIQHALDRARILERCGYTSVPLVAGKAIRDADESLARESGIGVLIDTDFRNWPATA